MGICVLLMVNSLVVKCQLLVADVLLPLAKRACCLTRRAWTHAQLQRNYAPRAFVLAPRYAHICTIIFSALFFSSAMPVLVWLAAADLLLWFWGDRLLYYTVYQRPPQFDDTLARFAARWLPYAGGLHLCVVCLLHFMPPEMIDCDCPTVWRGLHHEFIARFSRAGPSPPASSRVRLTARPTCRRFSPSHRFASNRACMQPCMRVQLCTAAAAPLCLSRTAGKLPLGGVGGMLPS